MKLIFIFLYKLFWIFLRVQGHSQGYIQQNNSGGGRAFLQGFFPPCVSLCNCASTSFSECHPSCWLCTGPSADNCTSCPPSSSLHKGRCLPGCPQGSFVQDNQCHGERPRPYPREGPPPPPCLCWFTSAIKTYTLHKTAILQNYL